MEPRVLPKSPGKRLREAMAGPGVKDAIRRLNLYAEAGASTRQVGPSHCVAAKFSMVAAR